MTSTKSATLTFRIEPELKEAVRTAAVNEHRSIANRISVMIRDYCGRMGVETAEPNAPYVVRQPPAKSKRTVPMSK